MAPRDLEDLGRRLGRRVDDLEARLLGRLEALPRRQAGECRRLDGEYQGGAEVVVQVRGSTLRFLRVPAAHDVLVGMDRDTAEALYRRAKARSKQAVMPWILRSVPAARVSVPAFFLQERLIDPALYAELTGGGDARRVSYRQVAGFVDALNELCAGRAAFDLPSEEQFVAAAQRIYDPLKDLDAAQDDLPSCRHVRWRNQVRGSWTQRFSQLLGHYWQLTRSPCVPFEGAGEIDCEAGTRVRKGGSSQSSNPLECLPEFRGDASDDVPLKNTSLRLVLVE